MLIPKPITWWPGGCDPLHLKSFLGAKEKVNLIRSTWIESVGEVGTPCPKETGEQMAEEEEVDTEY